MFICSFYFEEKLWGIVRSGSGVSPEGANFSRLLESVFNDQICSNYYNVMYWERILQKNHLITCFRRFYQRLNHLAAYIPILGWVDVGNFINVANIHSGLISKDLDFFSIFQNLTPDQSKHPETNRTRKQPYYLHSRGGW